MPERIYRCSDGHLYVADAGAAFLKSVHLGFGTHFQRCPVDGKWRKASPAEANTLSESELAEARSRHF